MLSPKNHVFDYNPFFKWSTVCFILLLQLHGPLMPYSKKYFPGMSIHMNLFKLYCFKRTNFIIFKLNNSISLTIQKQEIITEINFLIWMTLSWKHRNGHFNSVETRDVFPSHSLTVSGVKRALPIPTISTGEVAGVDSAALKGKEVC